MDKSNDLDLNLEINEVEVEEESCASVRVSLGKSLFNASLDVADVLEMHKTDDWKDYEDQLRREIREWGILWRNSLQQLAKSKTSHPTIDVSILPADKMAYLKAAPNLRTFLRDSVRFLQEAHLFLEFHHAEMSDTINIVKELCDYKLHQAKANARKEFLTCSRSGDNASSP